VSLWRLIFRSLRYYRRSNLALVAGAAVGVAVIVGSLLIGDSMKGSLRDLALERLGRIDYALLSHRLFREPLAEGLERGELASRFDPAVGVLMLEGTAVEASGDMQVPHVSVLGVPRRFWTLGDVDPMPRLAGRMVAVNRAMADAMNLQPGQSLVLRVPDITGAMRGSLFGRRSRADTVTNIRVTVSAIVADRGLGTFSLRGDRVRPRNVYVSLPWLQQRVGAESKVNALLVAGKVAEDPREAVAALNRVVATGASLNDYRLRLVFNADRRYWSLESRDMVLPPKVVRAAERAARDIRYRTSPVSVYLANRIVRLGSSAPGEGLPYSTIAFVGAAAASPFGPLPSATESPLPAQLAAGDILLNKWAADDLGAKIGERVRMEHYRVLADGTLDDGGAGEFTVRGIVALRGAAADPGLVAEVEGVTNADDMSGWDPPFEIDNDRIRDKDEAYWNTHGATPKAFLSAEAARALWRTAVATDDKPWPWVTSVRMAPVGGVASEEDRERIARAVLAHIAPASTGMGFRAIKALALKGAEGSSDFASLFLGMSLFLVIAAALLVALLVRLAVEQRARQIGMLLASGFRPRTASRLLMVEGLILSLVAALVGMPLGVAYARIILLALATAWGGVVGSFTLSLHVTAGSLAIGGASGLIVALVAVGWATRILRRTNVLTLLGGWRALTLPAIGGGRTRVAETVAVVCLVVAAMVWRMSDTVIGSTLAYFLIGALVLASGIAALSAVVRIGSRRRRSASGLASLAHLALRDVARQRLRSVLIVGLVAVAVFAIVTVAANRVDLSTLPTTDRASGSGGFTLVARSDLPIYIDPGTREGRKALGFDAEAERVLAGVEIISLRIQSGDDASCLNLQRPLSPRVVGVPTRLADRNGFSFVSGPSDAATVNPWRKLDDESNDNTVPAFGDMASLKWILKADIGDVVNVSGANGDMSLRVAGQLAGSIWQSDLLISEQQFIRRFGADTGYRMFLVDVPADRERDVRRALQRGLGDMGLEIRRTADVLARFAGVQNAYLSTFRTLGGLGLVLGTFAVVTVLLRNIVERRSELGTLMALGFTRRQIVRLVTLESILLVAMGLAIGTVAGLVAVAPHLSQARADVPWPAIVGTLAMIAAVACGACRIAAGRAVGRHLLTAIRSE
jgi:putative ABC transport system permease protein